MNDDVGADVDRLGVLHLRVAALVVAADENFAAAGRAAGVDPGLVDKTDIVAEDLDRAALAFRGARVDGTGNDRRPGLGFDFNVRRLGKAARRDVDVAAGAEHDAAALVAAHGIGAHFALLVDEAGVDARLAALGDDLADVERLAARLDLDAQARQVGLDDVHRLAGGEDHLPLRRGDDAVVLDVRRDEVDAPAGRRGDGAVVHHAAGDCAGFEFQLAGEEVRIADVERR